MLESDIIECKEAHILAKTAKLVFCSDELQNDLKKLDIDDIQLKIINVIDLTDEVLNKCINLLNNNLGTIYSSINGAKWKDLKRKEMLENGLVYIILSNIDSGEFFGFMSMKIINEYEFCVLYLYEIQLDKAIRNLGLGTILLDKLDLIVQNLNTSDKLKKLWLKNFPDEYIDISDKNLLLSGIGLTVFSVNKNALKLYNRLGFKQHRDSPQKKILRNNKIIEPDYYILEKKIL